MKPIVTLTLNPSIDSSCQAETVQPTLKVRTFDERYDPGGGGINVARVIKELGGETIAIFFAGGITGQALTEMVEAIGLPYRSIPITHTTRVSKVVYERATGEEYRFVPSGPRIEHSELDALAKAVASIDADYVVASGSLPNGVAADFYADINRVVTEKGGRLVLDTSGEALGRTLERGVFMVKPNLRELESLAGRPLFDPADQEAAALELVTSGKAEVVTVTLGPDGAILATEGRTLRLKGPNVAVKSAVGAGDSFVGAMTLALAQGRPPEDALAFAVATGTATVLTMGTELCHRDDVERIYREILANTGA